MFDLEFHKPGKSYKLVKAVTISLFNSAGEGSLAKVPVYLRTTGTPSFSVGLPKPYADFWEAHRERLWQSRTHRSQGVIDEGLLTVEQFDQMEPALKWLAQEFASDVKNRRIVKVISLSLMLKGEGVSFNPPSFQDDISHIAGVGASILYEVNGRLYWNRSGDRARNPEPDYLPAWEDLTYRDNSRGGRTIPYSVAAWQTLEGVKSTLQSAATVLAGLKDPEAAVLLLSSGALRLGGPAK